MADHPIIHWSTVRHDPAPIIRAFVHPDLRGHPMIEIPEPGTRIALVQLNDPYVARSGRSGLRPGAQGTAGRYDRLGGLSVVWDNGSRLSLLPDEGDAWRAL